jgi:hypothetical protein
MVLWFVYCRYTCILVKTFNPPLDIFKWHLNYNLWNNVNFYTKFCMSILYYSTKGKFNCLRSQWTMTISIWKGKSCSFFVVNKYLFLIYHLDLLNISDTKNHVKLLENIPRMSAEERGRAIDMLQTDCSIRKVKFWKCSMVLLIIQFRCFNYE